MTPDMNGARLLNKFTKLGQIDRAGERLPVGDSRKLLENRPMSKDGQRHGNERARADHE